MKDVDRNNRKNGYLWTILRKLKNFSDCIIPILGYTGMGKTFLMHYSIKDCSDYDGIIKNESFIATRKWDNGEVLFIYASYDASREEGVDKGRLASKFGAASNVIIDKVNIPNTEKSNKESISEEVAAYIRKNKPELLELYAETPDDTDIEKAKCLYKRDKLAYEAEKLK